MSYINQINYKDLENLEYEVILVSYFSCENHEPNLSLKAVINPCSITPLSYKIYKDEKLVATCFTIEKAIEEYNKA